MLLFEDNLYFNFRKWFMFNLFEWADGVIIRIIRITDLTFAYIEPQEYTWLPDRNNNRK